MFQRRYFSSTLGNIVGLLVVLSTVPWWAAILRIPFPIIAPVIVVICAAIYGALLHDFAEVMLDCHSAAIVTDYLSGENLSCSIRRPSLSSTRHTLEPPNPLFERRMGRGT